MKFKDWHGTIILTIVALSATFFWTYELRELQWQNEMQADTIMWQSEHMNQQSKMLIAYQNAFDEKDMECESLKDDCQFLLDALRNAEKQYGFMKNEYYGTLSRFHERNNDLQRENEQLRQQLEQARRHATTTHSCSHCDSAF